MNEDRNFEEAGDRAVEEDNEKYETMEYTIVSDCCSTEMEDDESHCPSCKDGCGKTKLYEDGKEEDVK